MKKLLFLLLLLVISCSGQSGLDSNNLPPVSLVNLSDSTDKVLISMKLELPANGPVRDTLIDMLYYDLGMLYQFESDCCSPVKYPKKNLLDIRDSLHRKVLSLSALNEDDSQWGCYITLKKISESQRYAVFNLCEEAYFGGAHGSIAGSGNITLNITDGTILRGIIAPSSVAAIQPLLRKGLLEYFASCENPLSDAELDDNLLLGGKMIPIPIWEPIPLTEGLLFTYQQYEIGCYAIGMPSFLIPYQKIVPYMSKQAKEVFLNETFVNGDNSKDMLLNGSF